MNRTAAIIAGIYCLITSGIAIRSALDPSPGFGALNHMFTFFATAPISVPLSILGMEPNFSRPSTVVLVILAATALVYACVVLVGWIIAWLALKY